MSEPDSTTATQRSSRELMLRAWRAKTTIPAFNIPYLPMMQPVVAALRDTRCFGFIVVARLEWVKFRSGSLRAVRDEYQRVKDERFTRLHLDHVPVIDEDNLRVDYAADIGEALQLGYQSVMVDGSRLPLDQNIDAVRHVVEMAHPASVPVEAELGAIMGHEAGPLPPYEQLFATGKGFTDSQEARRFVQETNVDWLSVAVGSVHGAITNAARTQKKVAARLNIDQLDRIADATHVPLVLHGGTGIEKSCVREAIAHGIAKINVATAIRQPYQAIMDQSVEKAQQAVYTETVRIVREELEIEGSADRINPSRSV